MDIGFIKTLQQEWPTVSGAPWSVAIIAVIALGLGFGAATLYWGGTVSTLRERLGLYQDRLQGASPDQAAGEIKTLREQLSDTRKQLAAIVNPPRDDNAVYQKGRRMGAVTGVQVSVETKVVLFGQMTVAGEFDPATNVEFRNLVLAYASADAISKAQFGLNASTTLHNARFSIVGNRQD